VAHELDGTVETRCVDDGVCVRWLLGTFYLMGVHPMGVHLTGVHLIGVYLMGVHLIDVYFTDVYMFPNPKRLWEKPPGPPPYKR
jgi:hypothetical protein